MADPLISHETILASLHDIRLPTEAAGGLLAEVAVAIGLGFLCAGVLGFVIPVFAGRRRPEVGRTLVERVADLRHLPDEARAMALLHLMRSATPETMPKDRTTLYAADGFPTAAELETALLNRGTANA